MSWSEWGGFCYINGVRHRDREDYHGKPERWVGSWHILLGSKEVFLGGYKSSLELLVAEQERNIYDCALERGRYGFGLGYFGKIRGQIFGAMCRQDGHEIVDAFLLENGNSWTATFGHMIGAGWEDQEFNAKEEVVLPCKDHLNLLDKIRVQYPKAYKKYMR